MWCSPEMSVFSTMSMMRRHRASVSTPRSRMYAQNTFSVLKGWGEGRTRVGHDGGRGLVIKSVLFIGVYGEVIDEAIMQALSCEIEWCKYMPLWRLLDRNIFIQSMGTAKLNICDDLIRVTFDHQITKHVTCYAKLRTHPRTPFEPRFICPSGPSRDAAHHHCPLTTCVPGRALRRCWAGRRQSFC